MGCLTFVDRSGNVRFDCLASSIAPDMLLIAAGVLAVGVSLVAVYVVLFGVRSIKNVVKS